MIGVILMILLSANQASSDPVRTIRSSVVHSIGIEESAEPIPRPTSAVQAEDGTIFVYSDSDCSIFILDEDWNVVRHFGQCGDGPGDLAGTDGLHIVDGQLWATQRVRVSVFSFDGKYQREASLSNSPLTSALYWNGFLVGMMYPSFDRLGMVDLSGTREPAVLMDLQGSDHLKLLGHDSNSVYYAGTKTGLVYDIDLASRETKTIDLGLPRATVQESSSESGVVSNWRAAVFGGWMQSAAELYLLTAVDNPLPSPDELREMQESGHVPPIYVRKYGSDFGQFELMQFLPEGIFPSNVCTMRDGSVTVLDTNGSRIWNMILEGDAPD